MIDAPVDVDALEAHAPENWREVFESHRAQIAALTAERDALKAERDEARQSEWELERAAKDLDAALAARDEQIAKLTAALETACQRGCSHCADDIRRARAAITTRPEE